MGLHRQVRVLVAGRAVDPETDSRPGPDEILDPARPRTQAHVARGAVGHAGVRLGDAVDLGVAQVDPVRVPDVVPSPAKVLHQLVRAPAELLDAEALLVQSLGEVRVQSHLVATGEGG